MTGKAIKEPRTRTPEEKVLIGIIQQAMEDSFDLSSSTNLSMAEVQQARNWFYTKACSDICDHLNTTHDHIKKLYNILSDKYKRGLVTRDELRFAIRRLELKL
tara:strand:+ start:222 stop:530 length:309 start_codon:yes stop_codon:yes gene_type:complete